MLLRLLERPVWRTMRPAGAFRIANPLTRAGKGVMVTKGRVVTNSRIAGLDRRAPHPDVLGNWDRIDGRHRMDPRVMREVESMAPASGDGVLIGPSAGTLGQRKSSCSRSGSSRQSLWRLSWRPSLPFSLIGLETLSWIERAFLLSPFWKAGIEMLPALCRATPYFHYVSIGYLKSPIFLQKRKRCYGKYVLLP